MDVHPRLQPTIGSFKSPGGTGGKKPRFLLANLRCLSLQVALKEPARILDGAGDEGHTLEFFFPSHRLRSRPVCCNRDIWYRRDLMSPVNGVPPTVQVSGGCDHPSGHEGKACPWAAAIFPADLLPRSLGWTRGPKDFPLRNTVS